MLCAETCTRRVHFAPRGKTPAVVHICSEAACFRPRRGLAGLTTMRLLSAVAVATACLQYSLRHCGRLSPSGWITSDPETGETCSQGIKDRERAFLKNKTVPSLPFSSRFLNFPFIHPTILLIRGVPKMRSLAAAITLAISMSTPAISVAYVRNIFSQGAYAE